MKGKVLPLNLFRILIVTTLVLAAILLTACGGKAPLTVPAGAQAGDLVDKQSCIYETDEAEKARERNVVSYRISPYGVNLPCGMNMDEEKVKCVCKVFRELCTGH